MRATETEPVALPAWPTVQPLEVDWPSLPDLDLRADEAPAVPSAESTPEPAAAAPAAEPVLVPDDAAAAEEAFKVVGPLRIEIGMFNVFLNEADERSRLLSTQLAEWALDPKGPPGDAVAVAAHALAGSSATIGFTALSSLARALERALARSNEAKGLPSQEPVLFGEAADNVQRLLHQFAAGFIEAPRAGLVERLDAYQPKAPAAQLPTAVTEEPFWYEDDDIDAVDTVDADLFPVFSEEADELLPRLQGHMRGWAAQPLDRGAAAACMRDLHTFKGGARLAGAMRLGEMAHRMETAVEQLLARGSIIVSDVESLTARADGIEAAFEALRTRHAAAPATAAPLVQAAAKPGPVPAPAVLPAAAAAAAAFCDGEGGEPRVLDPIERIDWARFASAARSMAPDEAGALAAGGGVRVRSSLLDRLVNHAGEVSIARTRIDADLALIKGSLGDLSENLDRLRRQLRDVEVQAESQINSRLEAAKAAAVEFDPLEMDRYTRVQELTRMMAESVNDVATVQRTLQRALQSSEDQVAQQGRLARSLQEDLLRTRMVEFESLSDRLYRVVRLAAKETGKQVRLDIVGGSIEIDRSVLERMTAPFEHLLRNAVTHGIERPELRQAAGKPAAGTIQIRLEPDGNEVAVEFADDGQGLDLARIRARAIEKGLLAADAQPSDGALADLIFAPGFSTAETVTELAGRGVGMDVVRSEVLAMGGRVQTQTQPGQGTRFRMVLPLTTAVTQVVMLRCGDLRVAVPANLVEIVRREPAADVQAAYLRGQWSLGGESFPFHWLGALLGREPAGAVAGRTVPILVVRSAAQRVALHVDEVLGNQEVVVKNLGPQLSRLPGLSGLTLLPSGAVAAIYNPVALASVYGSAARRALQQTLLQSPDASGVGQATAAPQAPLVLVVDDSLTVRRVTQRLLTREGYRVTAAKDGLDALERVAEEMPSVILSDIEMPRMDGFDFVRSLRSEPATASVPIIMITSRIAQKHRDYAFELGVQHYLGKPYGEEELLRLVSKYARRGVAMASVSAVA